MTLYRICPFGAAKWKVQRRLPLWFWTTVTSYRHECSLTLEFDTEAEAEKYIDRCIESDHADEEWEHTAWRRKLEISPRRYP